MALFAGTGFVANMPQSPAALLGIRLSVSLLPAALCLAGAGLLFFYPLDEAQMAKIGRELAFRRIQRQPNPPPSA